MGITVEGFPCHSVLFCLLQIVDMARQRVVAVEVFYLLSPRLAHLAKRFVLLHARKSAPAEIGGYPRRGAAAEGIEYPVALIGRGKDHADQEAQRLLRRVLAAGLFPTPDSRHAPHVGHLLAVVESLHQLIVELMRHFLHLSCPNDKLGGIGEKATRDVGRRIGLLPRDHVQNLVAKLGQTVGHGKKYCGKCR